MPRAAGFLRIIPGTAENVRTGNNAKRLWQNRSSVLASSIHCISPKDAIQTRISLPAQCRNTVLRIYKSVGEEIGCYGRREKVRKIPVLSPDCSNKPPARFNITTCAIWFNTARTRCLYYWSPSTVNLLDVVLGMTLRRPGL